MKDKPNTLNLILESKIEKFRYDFSKNSKELFVDATGRLIHPAEFGTYREKICIDLLRNVVPMRLDFGSGFVIDSTGAISSQCDIVIFDSRNTPLIENSEKQRFFPVESVVGIGEVKSTLSKNEMSQALRKMEDVKLMRGKIEDTCSIIFDATSNMKRRFIPQENPRDQIFTFLICNSLSFNVDNLVNEFEDIYSEIPVSHRHNMILSLTDGTFMYHDGHKVICYPYWPRQKLNNCIVKPFGETFKEKHAHIFSFLNYMYLGIANQTILYPDLSYYIGSGIHRNICIQSNNSLCK